MDKKITALVPCKAGSERVKNKNTKPFVDTSLIEIKLKQLLDVEEIDNIIVSTDDPEVERLSNGFGNKKIKVIGQEVQPTNNEMISWFSRILSCEGILLWTHVTSPFCDASVYRKAIQKYKEMESRYDSLLSVQEVRGYIWDKSGRPLNYPISNGRWPRTQDVEPCYLLNSAIFILPMDLMKEAGDRVGKNPYYFPLKGIEGLDIDWVDDFDLGESLWKGLNK